ncbi:HAMP domain-containing sensor histidine kinase [Helicovermis profundi]|uniref:histidine kinase n=1 Tax=Helicovermis profundi TaxID=3065157 RepID=A0AAU9EJM0_9FIRM|nr:HAMP domain-containing sensor histidine kinase [Clostridia bacterium S502]
MGIKLKKNKNNKGKIGKKIFLSYIIVILITFVIIGISFSKISESYILDSTKKEISLKVDKITKVVKPLLIKYDKDPSFKISREDYNQTRLRVGGFGIDSQIYIYNVNKDNIFKLGNVPDNKIRKLVTKTSGRSGDIVYEARKVTNNEKIIGYVIVIAKIEDVKAINKSARRILIIALGISSIFSILLSVFMQNKIGKPISKLKNIISKYKISNKIDQTINTGDEIEDLYNAFIELTNKINSFSQNQKSFFQNASHELKTPLMSIQGYAEAIKDGVVKDKEKEESLDIIISESQRLKKIVEEMIMMTKLDDVSEIFTYKKEDIYDILADSLNSVQPVLDKNDIVVNFNCEKGSSGEFDRDKLTRAFINIIGNCARYARTKIDINVNISGEFCYIDILDDGLGFKIGEEKNVFDRFYKGEKGGSGIGLALTKVIIERHNGEIKAINNINYGALFKIILSLKNNI